MSEFKEGIRIGTMVNGKSAAHAIKMILPHGFECFAITFGGNCLDLDLEKISAETMDALGGKAVISCIGIYGNPMLGDESGQNALESIKKVIDNAHLFGTDLVTGFTGADSAKSVADNMLDFKNVWTPLAKQAGDKGVRIAFENCEMGGTWQSPRFNIATIPTAWEMMFNEIPSDNLGLEWEPCHQMVKLIDPMAQLRKWKEKILHVHGKDATIKKDILAEKGINGPEPFAFHRTPGFGDSNWTDIISELRACNYTGAIDIEGWHDPVYRGELEMTGQVRGLNYLKDCRGGSFAENP